MMIRPEEIELVTRKLIEYSIPEPNTGCLLWFGSTAPDGYGNYTLSGSKRVFQAHVLAYFIHKGEVPKGYDVHHTCETRACVEPAHLEAWSRSWHRLQHNNGYKGNICKNGHDLEIEGTKQYSSRKGGYIYACRACGREKMRRRRGK